MTITRSEKRIRVFTSILLVMMLLAGMFAVPVAASAASDVEYITNGGKGLYYPGAAFVMKGKTADKAVKVELAFDGGSPFASAEPEVDANGFFTADFQIPSDAKAGSKLSLLINGTEKGTYTLSDASAAVGSGGNQALSLDGFTADAAGNIGSVGSKTISTDVTALGLAFSKNVNYFVNNNAPAAFADNKVIAKIFANEKCFTLYEGETGTTAVDCKVTLLGEGGDASVSYVKSSGASASTSEKNVIYVKPAAALKADTVYRLEISSLVTSNSNVHLADDITVFYKTAADQNEPEAPAQPAEPEKPAEPETPVQPVETTEPAKVAFDDVKAGSWFESAVNFAVTKGLFNGTGEGKFSPNASMTRGMLVTVLARYSGVDTAGGSNWMEKGIAWAVAQGISDGTNPEGGITREQLAVMLYRNAGSPDTAQKLSAFTDRKSVSEWAKTGMAWAVEKGIITGNGSDTILDPQGSATRAQVATMMMRYSNLQG